MGLGLPGGRWGDPLFPPHDHGPVVLDYGGWSGAVDVGTPRAGDLCIWAGSGAAGHIGIAISDTEMVSALNPALGCKRTPIVGTGPSGVPLIYRRVTGLAGAGLPVVYQPGSGRAPVGAVLIAALAGVAVFAAAVTGAAVLVPWILSQARGD